MPYIWKVLWSRRRRRKQNKLFSIKYQSYHRHHLIRISSCHTLQRAKKTKKRNSPQKSNRKDPHDSSIYPIEEAKNVPLQHSFNSFGKWCSFPQELFNVKKRAMQDTLKTEKPLLLSNRGKKQKNLYIANFYVTRNIILQSASCFQHFCCQI